MNTAEGQASRVLLVDDHGIVRHGIAVLLSEAPDLQICGEAGTYDEALAALRDLRPDVAVIDLILHDRSGLELIRAARAEGINLPILALSMHDESTHAEKALRAGAQGYVMKEDADEVLVDAIRAVLGGGVYVSGELNARMLHDYIHGDEESQGTGVDQLTEREREIFTCMGQGMTTKKIAERFELSSRTVEVHRARIKKKLQCEDAAQLLREAVRWVETMEL